MLDLLTFRRKMPRLRTLPHAISIAFIGVLCIVAVGQDLYRTWQARAATIMASEKSATNVVWSVAQNATNVFQLVDHGLNAVMERVKTDGTGPAQIEPLRHWMALWEARLPMLKDIAVIDENGFAILSGSVSSPINHTDLPYFQHHLLHFGGGLTVGVPVRTKIGGAWVIPVSMRLDRAEGGFAGIVLATFDLAYFQGFHGTFQIGDVGSIVLLRDDGILLTRTPFAESAMGTDILQRIGIADLVARQPSGTLEARSSIDGFQRIAAYRRVPGYPLLAFATLGKDEQLAGWRVDASYHLLWVALVVVLLGFFAIRLIVQIRLLARAERTAAAAVISTTEAAARYQLLADNATDMIFILDRQRVRRYVSPSCRDLMGYEPEELIGSTPLRWIHPDDIAGATAIYDEMFAGRDRAGVTGRMRHRDGRWIWVEATYKLIRDPVSGEPLEVCGTIRDISRRVAAEALLREAEERNQLLLGSLSEEAIYMLDPDGRVANWNLAAERIKGYTAADVVGRHYSLFFTPEDVAAGEPARALRIARETGRYTADGWRIRKDGSRMLVSVAIDTIRDEDGTLRGFAKVTHDITQRRIEEEQRAIIVESTPNGILIVNEAGEITLANTRVEEIFDYPHGALVGQRVEVLVFGSMRVEHAALRAAFRDGGNGKAMAPNRHVTGRRSDGTPIPLEIALSPVQTPRGRIVVASLVDLTERLRREAGQRAAETREREVMEATNERLEKLSRHLAKARDRAEQANQAKSRFLTGITHELRTPLNGILGYAQLLRLEGGLRPKQIERVDAMLDSGRHLLGMINSVLDLAQIEAERIDLKPSAIDLPKLARSCIEVVLAQAQDKGLVVYLAPLPQTLPGLVADPTRLRQVLVNLLGNAVKFTPAGAVELRLRSLPDTAAVRLEVRDTGPGIAATQCGHLFKEFERLDKANSRATEGAGLGLAISEQLVRNMGGQIGYHDNPGGGSVFWVELPAVALADAGTEPEPLAPRVGAPGPGLLVLVVDDLGVNRDIAASFLRIAGHRVVCTDNGVTAVELAATEDFAVILMDVRMPGMDGLEATRRIRALAPPRGLVPVVALTAQAFAEQVEQCREAGMNSHISKPFEQADLVAQVERLAAAPLRPRFDILPAAGRPAAAPDDQTLLDRVMMAETVAQLPPGDVPAHFETLLGRAESLLDDLRAADTVDSTAALVDAAHRLGGSVGMFGFNRLATSVRRFEAAVEFNSSDIMDKSKALAAAIEEAIDVVRQEILVFLARP